MTEQELTLAALDLSGKLVTEDGALYKVESKDSRRLCSMIRKCKGTRVSPMSGLGVDGFIIFATSGDG